MIKSIEELKQDRIILLYEYQDSKTEFVKNNIHRKIKAINVKLYKETKNPIYL
jgi:hypothetical protein